RAAEAAKTPEAAPEKNVHSPHLSPVARKCRRYSREADAARRRHFSPGAAAPRRPPDSRRSLLLYQRPLLPRQARLRHGLRSSAGQCVRPPPFAPPPADTGGVLVITAGGGLLPADTMLTSEDLRDISAAS